ncbi:MAG: hypothetical protein OSB29_07605, partial [Verrucomicrobiota bacterium]|nr:hypothetical protein [Verrucomicrobiota bacterium]
MWRNKLSEKKARTVICLTPKYSVWLAYYNKIFKRVRFDWSHPIGHALTFFLVDGADKNVKKMTNQHEYLLKTQHL